MLNIPLLLSTDEYCLTHTGLRLSEFAYLTELYRSEYEIHMNTLYEKKHGKKRTRTVGGGQGGNLKTLESKLFFILYYLKTYQTYATLGGAIDLPKSKAYQWVQILLPPLLSALKKTVWYLQPHLKNWQESWNNIPKGRISSSME